MNSIVELPSEAHAKEMENWIENTRIVVEMDLT